LLAVMLNLALVVIGAISYTQLGVELFPQVDIPSVVITTQNPGAGPEEMESGVTSKIESAVNTVSGVTSIQSVSQEGLSTVSVAFDIKKNGDAATQQVRDRLSAIPDMPHGATTPRVDKLDFDAAPVMRVTLTSPRSLPSLTRIANQIVKQKLERVNGVGQIRLVGGSERQIRVNVYPERLGSLQFTIAEVAAGIRQQNLEMPGGRLNEGSRELTVRTIGSLQQPSQLTDLTIGQRGKRPIHLSEVARVEDTTAELRSASRLNGVPAVSLLVMKQSGQNTIDVIDSVKAELSSLRSNLPSDVKVEIIGDQSVFIRASVEQLQEHLIIGSLFAAFVVYLFLRDWRATLISSIAIPVSLIASFALIDAAGYTLNQVTMLALTLMVGIVIDDAIVVLENIYHVMTERGLTPFQAASEATREIGPAVLATTLSLLAVFLPVAFMHGLVGRFLSSFGLTSAFAIAISLFVSFTLTPTMSARMLRPGSLRLTAEGKGFYARLEVRYVRMLSWSLSHRPAIVVTSILLMLSAIPLGMLVGKDFQPVEDQSRFEVALSAPEGSTLAQTLLDAERIAVALRKIDGVTQTLTSVGGNDGEPVNQASIYVTMLPIEKRSVTQLEAMATARDSLKAYPASWTMSVQAAETATGGSSQAADVEYLLIGPDLDRLNGYAKELARRLAKVSAATDIQTSVARPKPELRVVIDRARAADLGVSTSDLAQSLNSLVAGQQIAEMNLADTQVPIWLQVAPEYRSSIEGLRQLSVSSSKGIPVSLQSIAALIPGTGPAMIERYDRQRKVSVFANVRAGSSQSAVNDSVERELQSMNLGAGYQYEQGGNSKELASAGSAFGLAFLLSFVFMYMVLTALLESLTQPVIILLTLPLSVPCGILGLVLMRQNMNIYSALGILLLFGVVKKNAILQITHANQLREGGMPRFEAMIKSNRDRLRPILMTTLALVAGMTPLVLARGPGSSTSRSIGVLVAAGQTFCLVLTLLMVPVFYTLFEDIAALPVWRRWRPMRAGATTMLLAVLLLPVAVDLRGQQADLQKKELPDDLDKWNRDGRQMQISLRQAIALALQNDQDVALVRLDVQSATLAVGGAQGAFDPILSLKAFRERRTVPVSSALAGSATGRLPESEFVATPQVSGLLPWLGTTYTTSLLSRRLNSQNAFDPLAPQYQTGLNLAVVQPLWRNRSIDDAREQLWIAQRKQQLSAAQFRQHLTDRIYQVIGAYWDFYASRQALETRRDAFETARRLVRANERRVREGLAAENELVESLGNEKRTRETTLASFDGLNQAENEMKTLILAKSATSDWDAELIPTSIPAPPASAFPNLQSSLDAARKNRPELEVLEDLRKVNEVTKRYAQNQVHPAIDLGVSYTASGLAGILADRPPNPLLTALGFSPVAGGGVPPFLLGGYGSSLSNLAAGDFPTLRFSLNVSLPLRNRTADASAAEAAIGLKRVEIQRQQTEKLIEQEVRNGEYSLRITEERSRVAAEAAAMAEKLLQSEQRLYEAGMSSVFLVPQRQDSLAESRLTEADLKCTLLKVEAAYRRAIGTLLEANGIKVADQM
jgi:HAE1 family hydrophobic/amphiphilic exporter-1